MMKVIIEVKTYLLADVTDTDEANRCGGRLSEQVADLCAGFSPHTTHITTGFGVLSSEATDAILTTEVQKDDKAASQSASRKAESHPSDPHDFLEELMRMEDNP